MKTTGHTLDWGNRRDHILARCGVNRMGHRVEPGLYSLGRPGPESPVLVTANYTLSFDALRSSLAGVDCYILVVDTQGVNVWCAAGKGTFCAGEVVRRVEETGLGNFVSHRRLVLPQLSAPGVDSAEVERLTGFRVDFGPVRASDLPRYLRKGPDAETRRVRFPLRDRLVLVPVEVRNVLPWFLLFAAFQWFTGGLRPVLMLSASILAGAVAFPILLPWLPTRDFSTKGFIMGVIVAAPFALSVTPAGPEWHQLLKALGRILTMAPVTAFVSLNFTGATTFTSRTGVRREIFKYVPLMAITFAAGILVSVVLAFVKG